MKGRKHTPDQIIREAPEADRMLGEGKTTTTGDTSTITTGRTARSVTGHQLRLRQRSTTRNSHRGWIDDWGLARCGRGAG